MAKVIEIRGVKIGEGVPKIIVPIVGVTKEEILTAAASFEDVRLDLVEWRVDWFEDAFDFAKVEDILKDLRAALGNVPLLFTFRTSKEGGEKAIDAADYARLNILAAPLPVMTLSKKSSPAPMQQALRSSLPTTISTKHLTRMIS